MFESLLERIVVGVLVLLLIVLIPTAGWNWWRKNVYYDALHLVAAQRVQDVSDAQVAGQAATNRVAADLLERSNNREKTLELQLRELASQPPAERVVYRMRDRFLPVSCPGGAAGGTEPASGGGLQVADEQFLVRESDRADGVVDERNALIDLYNQNRQAVIDWNRKHGR